MKEFLLTLGEIIMTTIAITGVVAITLLLADAMMTGLGIVNSLLVSMPIIFSAVWLIKKM